MRLVKMKPELSSPPQHTKRNEFFVDTKSTCFLCLKEIPSVPPVINLENDEDENKVNDQDKVEGKIFCMRAIFRYLKMNPGILFKAQLTGSLLDSTKLLNKIADWKVFLCLECVPIASRLSHLCCQMEMVQMKVDHSLQLFHEIIEKSEKDPVKVEKFRGKLTNPLETLQATIADLLRNETHEKCNGSFRTSIPRVTLSKCEKLFTFVGTKETLISSATSTAPPPPPPPVSLPQKLPPPPPIVVPISKNLIKPASIKCTLCSMAFGSQNGLTKHIRRRHPESDMHSSTELLSVHVTHKCHLCSVVCSTFKSLRNHITNRHHIQNSVIFYTCNGCGLKLPSKPEWIKHTRLHCDNRRTNTTSQGRITIKLEKPPSAPVQIPPPTLPPPPVSVQITPPPLPPPPPPPVSIQSTSATQDTTMTAFNLSKLMNPMPHFRTGNNEFLCSLCPVRNSNDIFRTEDQLKMHLFVKHVDYFFSPLKLPEVNKLQFETYCQQIIENHMMPITLGQGSGPLTYKCMHCSSVFNIMRAINAHLIQSHYSLLVPKLMDLQRMSINQIVTIPVSTPPPPIPIPQPPPPPVNSPLKSQWVPKRKLKCSNCSAVFSQSSSLSRHRRLNCPGISASSKGHGDGVSSQLTDRGNVGRFQCTDCGAWFVQKPSLARHRKRWHSKNDTSTLSTPALDFPYVCDYCENRFASYQGKKEHMRNRCYKRWNHDNRSSGSNFGSPQTWQNDVEEGDQSMGPMVTSTFSLSIPTTSTPAHSNSWPCQNCGSSFKCPSSLNKHQQQYCHSSAPDGVASSQEHNQGISVGIENYYDENYISPQGAEGQVMAEQEEEEVYPGSYVSTKIEVLDFEQVQIFPNTSNHENSEIEEIEEMNNLYQGSMMVNEDGDEEIIFEGEGSSVDPLC